MNKKINEYKNYFLVIIGIVILLVNNFFLHGKELLEYIGLFIGSFGLGRFFGIFEVVYKLKKVVNKNE